MNPTLKSVLYGLAAATATTLLIGLPTDLIPNPWFTRMMESRPQDYVFLSITVVLAGLLAATYAFPAACPRYQGRFAAGGLLTVLAVGCPICNKLVVLALGTSGAMAWFEPDAAPSRARLGRPALRRPGRPAPLGQSRHGAAAGAAHRCRGGGDR
jgi:hypothetical protein